MRRPVLTGLLIAAAGLTALGVVTDRRAAAREAAVEDRFPPEGQIVRIGGRDVHVLVRGQGPDIVLIHGASGNLREMDTSLAARLADRYRVFMVDRPGHGFSERLGNAAAESPADQARVLSAAVAQMGARAPLVLGHSYGGAVAMAWALDYPASGVVVVSGATMPWPGEVALSYRVLGSTAGAALLAPLASAYVPAGYIESAVDGVFAPQSAPTGYVAQAGIPLAVRTETLRATNEQVASLRPHIVAQSTRYPAIALPVEILHGTADKTVYPDIHAEPLAALLPDARLTLLDGLGHMPHHIVPDDIVAAIDRAAARAGLR